jgi:hypothetical protein
MSAKEEDKEGSRQSHAPPPAGHLHTTTQPTDAHKPPSSQDCMKIKYISSTYKSHGVLSSTSKLKIHEKYYENTDKNDDIDTII